MLYKNENYNLSNGYARGKKKGRRKGDLLKCDSQGLCFGTFEFLHAIH